MEYSNEVPRPPFGVLSALTLSSTTLIEIAMIAFYRASSFEKVNTK